MYEETMYQKTADGKTFPQVLKGRNILTGIKVDKVCIVTYIMCWIFISNIYIRILTYILDFIFFFFSNFFSF